jgi:hypothetical protein
MVLHRLAITTLIKDSIDAHRPVQWVNRKAVWFTMMCQNIQASISSRQACLQHQSHSKTRMTDMQVRQRL